MLLCKKTWNFPLPRLWFLSFIKKKRKILLKNIFLFVDKVSCCKNHTNTKYISSRKKRVFIFSVDGAKKIFHEENSVFSFSQMLRLDFVMLSKNKNKKFFPLVLVLSPSIFFSFSNIINISAHSLVWWKGRKTMFYSRSNSFFFFFLCLSSLPKKHSELLRKSSSEFPTKKKLCTRIRGRSSNKFEYP